jgi:hypothetical protein
MPVSEVKLLQRKWREENVVFLRFYVLYLFNMMRYLYIA